MSLTKGISIQNSIVFAIFSVLLLSALLLLKYNAEKNITRDLISADSTFIMDSHKAFALEKADIQRESTK